MNNSSQSNSFYSLLKEKNSSQILNEMEKFINVDFDNIMNLKREEISKIVQELISKLVFDFARIWNINFTNKNSEYGKLIDNFESLLIKSLYPRLYSATKQEKEEDSKLEKLIKRFNFITPKNLNINEHLIDNLTLDLAINKLNEINVFRAPKDKSIIVTNFCRIINYMINTNKKPDEEIKAEKIYSIIVYALIKGNINKIKSNVQFLQLFRHRTRLESEEEFHINAVMVSIEYIETLTYKKLNIDKNEFLKKCEESEKSNDSSSKISTELIKNEQILQEPANSDQTLFELELTKLYNEYFTNCDLADIPLFKLENLYKDFKIVISMIKEFKNNQTKKMNSEIDKKNTNNTNNLIEI